MSMERWYRAPGATDLAGEAREGLGIEEAVADVDGDAAEDLRLLRRYEPVLRFTRGELFLPMSVSAYLERCGLWQSAESGRSRRRRAAAVRTGLAFRACEPDALMSDVMELATRIAQRNESTFGTKGRVHFVVVFNLTRPQPEPHRAANTPIREPLPGRGCNPSRLSFFLVTFFGQAKKVTTI